jgi:hypothetical protein
MFKNRAAVMKVAIGLTTLFAGVALGHWCTSSSLVANGGITSGVASGTPKSDGAGLPAAADSMDMTKAFPASAVQKKSLDEILKGRNPHDRTKDLEAYVGNLALSEFGATLKRLRQIPESSARELAMRLLVTRWGETDPEGALQFALSNHEFNYIASDVFQQLAADDVQSALNRAENIPDLNMRYEALRGVLSFMADQDPAGALQLASTFPSFPNNEPLSSVIYAQWAANDPQAAAAQAAQDSAGTGWRSPMGQVLRNWASQDPMAAVNWSMSVSDPAAQARDISQVMRQWSRDDLNAAVAWVSSAPAGTMRDAATASLAFSIAATDPTAAIGWAESIANAAQRENALQRLSREIMYRDPTNGAALLQAAGVPANLISHRR